MRPILICANLKDGVNPIPNTVTVTAWITQMVLRCGGM